MAYANFTLEMLRHKLGMTVQDGALFDTVGDLLPSAWLRESLHKGMGPAHISEKARGEFIVAPILAECRELMQQRINIFSGIQLDVEPARGLNGECDFVLARTQSPRAFQSPLMVIVEAKKHDIEEGVWQCAAQLFGASRFNEIDGKVAPYLYGCVTNGLIWSFLKLHGTQLIVHPDYFLIGELSKILWFVMECLQDLDQKVSEAA
jgi:hypothetical protein